MIDSLVWILIKTQRSQFNPPQYHLSIHEVSSILNIESGIA